MKSIFCSRALYIGAFLFLSLNARAYSGVLATEFFNYASSLDGANDSTGWGGEWIVRPADSPVPVEANGVLLYGVTATRAIALNPKVTDTGSIYIGFKVANVNSGSRAFIIALLEKGAEKVAIGQGKSKAKWGLLKSRSKEPWLESSQSSRPNGEPVQMVVRIDFKGEGKDTVKLFVGANLSAPEPTGESPDILLIDSVDVSRVDALRMQSFLDGTRRNVSGSGVVAGNVDNIVVATTWNDVATASIGK